MASTAPSESASQLRAGQSCLLNIVDEHFLVKIVEVGDEAVRITFPGKDYPVEGMRAYLEFHDEDGFDCYPSHVLEGPRPGLNTIILHMPNVRRRIQHRASWRIPTDLTVQIKEQAHVRKYDAAVLNLSSGGALIRTDAPFDLSSTVDIIVSLPGEASFTVVGQVVHVAQSAETERGHASDRHFGIRFVGLDPSFVRSLNRYLSNRLHDLYPSR